MNECKPQSARCFIFGALPVHDLPERPSKGDYVIAADKGYDMALEAGITPDLTVGDFDSRGEEPGFGAVVRLPVRKDDTDVGHAVALAMQRGYDDFVVYGAVGGKLDHTVANIQVASDIVRRGGRAVFYGESSFTVIRDSSIVLPARSGGRVSVFSLSERSLGVDISGLSYEVQDAELSRFFPLGVSNAFVGKPASVSVRDGELLIIW